MLDEAGATTAWPVPWEEVAGDRDGWRAAVEYALFRGAVGLGSRAGSAGRRAIALGLARIAKLVDRQHSASARVLLDQAFGAGLDPARREELVLAAWRHLFELTLEDARFNERVLGPRLLEHFEVEMCDDARRILEQRIGGLVIVPHVGMWEAMPAVGTALGFRPTYVVSRPPRNRPLSRFAQRVREERGYRLLHRHGAIESVTKVVQAGGYVGLMLDQRARGKTVLAPFFGRSAHCERSIAVLVRRLRKPVLSAACYRTSRPFHYRVVLPRVIWPEDFPDSSPETVATAINHELERLIHAAPEQYFWLHDRYRDAPPISTGP